LRASRILCLGGLAALERWWPVVGLPGRFSVFALEPEGHIYYGVGRTGSLAVLEKCLAGRGIQANESAAFGNRTCGVWVQPNTIGYRPKLENRGRRIGPGELLPVRPMPPRLSWGGKAAAHSSHYYHKPCYFRATTHGLSHCGCNWCRGELTSRVPSCVRVQSAVGQDQGRTKAAVDAPTRRPRQGCCPHDLIRLGRPVVGHLQRW